MEEVVIRRDRSCLLTHAKPAEGDSRSKVLCVVGATVALPACCYRKVNESGGRFHEDVLAGRNRGRGDDVRIGDRGRHARQGPADRRGL